MISNKDIKIYTEKLMEKYILEMEMEQKFGDKVNYRYWGKELNIMINKNYKVAYQMIKNMNEDYIKQIDSIALKDLHPILLRVFKQEGYQRFANIEFTTVQPEIEKGLFEIYFTSSVAGAAEFTSKVKIATTFSPANQYAIDYYKYLTDTRSKFLLDTNKKVLANTLKTSATEGLTLRETKKLIVDNLSSTSKIAARAHNIAVTETTTSLNWAKYQSGLATSPKVQLIKSWYTTGDQRVRPSHSILDGTTVKYEEPFITGMGNPAAYPADGDLPASDSVGCRCALGIAPA